MKRSASSACSGFTPVPRNHTRPRKRLQPPTSSFCTASSGFTPVPQTGIAVANETCRCNCRKTHTAYSGGTVPRIALQDASNRVQGDQAGDLFLSRGRGVSECQPAAELPVPKGQSATALWCPKTTSLLPQTPYNCLQGGRGGCPKTNPAT